MPFHEIKNRHITLRLLVGGLSILALWQVSKSLSLYGNLAREIHTVLSEGTLAAIAVVALIPVLIDGDWVQRVLALVLAILPVLALLDAFQRSMDVFFW